MASYSTKITKKVGIYKSAKTSSTKIGNYDVNDKVTVFSETSDTNGNKWAKTNAGWFMTYNKNKKQKTTSGKTTEKQISANEAASKKYRSQALSKKYENMKKMMKLESASGKLNTTMQLFGIPYQFTEYVDHKVSEVSDIYGRKYAKKFVLDGPIVTIMPGKPKYLPGQKDKTSLTQAFLEASSGNTDSLKQYISDTDDTKNLRLYDFETAYVEYMRYVNILCRTCAAFLELDTNSDSGYEMYKVNNSYPDLLSFDWKDYRWDGKKYGSTISKAVNSTIDSAVETVKTKFEDLKDAGSAILDYITGNKETSEKTSESEKNQLDVADDTEFMSDEEASLVETLGRKVHFVQFYCDPTATNYDENISNSSQQSQFKEALNGVSSTVKEIAFLSNTGGIDDQKIKDMGSGLIKTLGEALGGTAGKVVEGADTLVSRLLGFADPIIQGDNIIMPDIYSSSERSASITITIPLKPLYGNKYSYYFDYLVPLMHCIALAFPKAVTSNSYKAPFLVKAYMRGVFNCNLGLVTGISLQHEDTYNVDGLYMGGTVILNIVDLYPDIAMTPSNDPVLFVNNSSLVEYLATNCGLNLLESQFTTKVNLLLNNLKTYPGDTIDNAISSIGEKVDDIIYSWSGL